MEKKAQSFFLVLMAIFLVGVLIHLIIPLQITVNATYKIEEAYNGYKIEVEQNTVRSLAVLNSKVVNNQIQVYENVRSTLIRLFSASDKYEFINHQKIQINSAYQISTYPKSSFANLNLASSMWFATGFSSIESLSDHQKWIYVQYSYMESYINSLNLQDSQHQGLKNIEVYINYEGGEIYFEYPSTQQNKFENLSTPLYSEYYSKSIENYLNTSILQTLFIAGNIFKSCSPVLDLGNPFGVICLNIDIKTLVESITSALKVPDFELSISQYFLVAPVYDWSKSKYPQILASFLSDDLSTITIPNEEYFTDIDDDLNDLFTMNRQYELHVRQLNLTKNYYITPISTYNLLDNSEIVAYLIVVNNFEKAELTSQSRKSQFLVGVVVPCSILFILSSLAMGLIMRPIFTRLRESTTRMSEYCHFIKKNDLNLEISSAQDCADIMDIFNELQYLNLLNKLVTPMYLKVSFHERIIRLLRALKLFEELGYKPTNIYENLAKSYMMSNEVSYSLKYCELSIDETISSLGGMSGVERMLKEEAEHRSENTHVKMHHHKENPVLKNLRYKLWRQCDLLYSCYKSGDVENRKCFTNHLEVLKVLNKSTPIIEYPYCSILDCICKLDGNCNAEQLSQIFKTIKQIKDLVHHVENNKNAHKVIPIHIVYSYWYYLKGRYYLKVGESLAAYENFILGLNGHYFDPAIHKKIQIEIEKIIKMNSLKTINIDSSFLHLNDTENNSQKEFIFMCDISNPAMSKMDVGKWKNKSRKMAEHIFERYIKSRDRIGISEFCTELKVVCSLIEKNSSEHMLKKELITSMKARDQTIYSQILPNLSRTIERTKNLTREKIFIFFLKEGQSIMTEDIEEEVSYSKNSTFIFFVPPSSERIQRKEDESEGVYVLDLDNHTDLEIILGPKVIKRADNVIHLF